MIRAIGVSNFYPDRLVDICSFANIRPMVNQVEIHPLHAQKNSMECMRKYDVQPEAWASFREGRGGMLENSAVAEIAARHNKRRHRSSCGGICSAVW